MEIQIVMFVQFVVIEPRESTMERPAVMAARDSFEEASGKITHIRAGN